MNTLIVYGEHDSRNSFELDDETMRRIVAAAGEPVEFTLMMTTPKGRIVSLTCRASLEADGTGVRIQMPAGDL